MNDNIHQGHRARKRFGQNFLHDPQVIGRIVKAIAPKADDVLVEIGPGLGALTEPVAEQAGHLTVVELDRDLAERLRQHPTLASKLTIHQADAMKFDFRQLVKPGQKLKVFGNLPYNISTPLLFHLFEYADEIDTMHCMLQKEVAERIASPEGNKDYGILSVLLQAYYDIEYVFTVLPGAFNPPPKVDSGIIRLRRNQREKLPCNEKLFKQIVKVGFGQRRKMLRNPLKSLNETL